MTKKILAKLNSNQ